MYVRANCKEYSYSFGHLVIHICKCNRIFSRVRKNLLWKQLNAHFLPNVTEINVTQIIARFYNILRLRILKGIQKIMLPQS